MIAIGTWSGFLKNFETTKNFLNKDDINLFGSIFVFTNRGGLITTLPFPCLFMYGTSEN